MGLLRKLLRKPSSRQFGKMMIKTLRDGGIDVPMEFDHQKFRISFEGGFFNLHNYHDQYCKASRRDRTILLNDAVQMFIQLTTGLPEDFEDAKDRIFPRIRDADFYPIVAISMQIEETQFPNIPTKNLSDHLTVELCYDAPLIRMERIIFLHSDSINSRSVS